MWSLQKRQNQDMVGRSKEWYLHAEGFHGEEANLEYHEYLLYKSVLNIK